MNRSFAVGPVSSLFARATRRFLLRPPLGRVYER